MKQATKGLSVNVNGVAVGELSPQQVDEINQAVKQEKRLYVSQGLNILGCVLRGGSAAAQLSPVILVVVALLMAIDSPAQFNAHLNENPAGFVAVGILASLLVSGITACLAAAFGVTSYGFINHFTARKHFKIRQILRIPADGNIHTFEVSPTESTPATS
ncbi:hypothetical protein DENIT_20106 [Pseudomonas veronii]|uniref:hypothetical protein n=1 Tax=Pseudomonas veronii TaxID=76761 RepID=UPI00176DF3CE|nr:hypothetical protein [Pseudomonas veronii]CAD0264219.1 hypothetical protein DENIT_20106 [Pseudomonas veronii]